MTSSRWVSPLQAVEHEPCAVVPARVCCRAWCKRDTGLYWGLEGPGGDGHHWHQGKSCPWSSCYQHFKSQSEKHKKYKLGSGLTIPPQCFFFFPLFCFFPSQINIAKAAFPYCIAIAFSIKFPFDNKLQPVLGPCCQGPGGVPSPGLEASSEQAAGAGPFPWAHGLGWAGSLALRAGCSQG